MRNENSRYGEGIEESRIVDRGDILELGKWRGGGEKKLVLRIAEGPRADSEGNATQQFYVYVPPCIYSCGPCECQVVGVPCSRCILSRPRRICIRGFSCGRNRSDSCRRTMPFAASCSLPFPNVVIISFTEETRKNIQRWYALKHEMREREKKMSFWTENRSILWIITEVRFLANGENEWP